MVDHIDVEEVAVRSGTTAAWADAGAPTLGNGELGIDLDTHEVRIGDGTSVFADLPVTAGGAVVPRKLIGPVQITVNTPDLITDAGADLGITLPAGALIESAWLEGITFWNLDAMGETQYLSINVVPPGDLNAYNFVVSYQWTDGPNSQFNAAHLPDITVDFLDEASANATIDRRLPSRTKADMEVRVSAYGANPQAGESNLFVLYSVPPA